MRIYSEIYFFIMKVQTDHSVLEMITIMIKYSDFQMIVIFFIFSEFLDFEKKNIEKKLVFSEKIMSFFLSAVFVFSVKNLFLINLSVFCFLIFSVILIIQFSVFLK